jgi:general secretion pathway protein N
MNEIRSLRSLLVWIVPFAIVLAILGWETDWGDGVSIPVPVTPPTTPPPVSVALMPEYRIDGALAARRETIDRVLFTPTRRPAPPATQTPGETAVLQKGKYVLTGTAIAGNVATAMLREVAGGKSHTVRKGDKIDGALVADVTSDSIKLTQGANTEELHLKVALGPATTLQVPTPGALPGGAMPIPGMPMGTTVPAATSGIPRAVPSALYRQSVPGQAAAQPATGQRPGIVSVGQLLAERRAAAAAQAAAGGAAPPPKYAPKP